MPLELATPALSFAVAWLAVALMLRFPDALPLDRPNPRSLHAHPVPRTGGLGIMLGVLAAALWLGPASYVAVLALAFALAIFSVIDDVKGLPVFARLLAHLAAAAAFVALYAPEGFPLLGALAGIVAVAWMTNLYNFMDGSDGLAGGMAVFGFGAYGFAAWLGGDAALAGLGLAIAAAALAFLVFNFHPARIFMGDGGSIPLGFAAAALGLLGHWRGLWPLAFPVLVFSPFIVDASVTLARRLARGERVWQAHRSHYYQRLVRMGLGHRGTALGEYALMAACAGSALWLVWQPAWQGPLLLAWACVYVVLMGAVDLRWKRHEA